MFAEHLTEWFTVYAFDMRGHGGSGGVSDFGGAEIHDVDAVVALARREGHSTVVTVGTSQGGIAVLRHAAILGGVDAVVGISSLAYWDWRGGAEHNARVRLAAPSAHRPAAPPSARGACGSPRGGTSPSRGRRDRQMPRPS
jgi:pimeloyl-ACP methyl ester carboxylesterase